MSKNPGRAVYNLPSRVFTILNFNEGIEQRYGNTFAFTQFLRKNFKRYSPCRRFILRLPHLHEALKEFYSQDDIPYKKQQGQHAHHLRLPAALFRFVV